MTSIPVFYYRLQLSQRLATHQSPRLREFFGVEFDREVSAHNLDTDGRPVYEYPRVQFKVVDRTAVLLGLAEGALLLQRLCRTLDEAELGDGGLTVVDTESEMRDEAITACSEPIEYRFVTPWLGLNQKNFRSYTGSRNRKFRKDELSRILVGNCLGLAKSLDIRFPIRIDAEGHSLTSIKTEVDGHGAIGFVGKFKVNLKLPEYFGLGRAVARGFGTVQDDQSFRYAAAPSSGY